MEVVVKDVCGRCSKAVAKTVDAEAMTALLKDEQAKKTATEELIATLTAVDATLTPEIVVLVKGNTGYMVETLDNLCTAPEGAKRRTGCSTRVMNLIEEIFLKKEPKKNTSKAAAPKKGTVKKEPKK